MKQNQIQHNQSVTIVKKCAGEKSDKNKKTPSRKLGERREERGEMSSLRCVVSRSSLSCLSCRGQVRNFSAQALPVSVEDPASGLVKADKQKTTQEFPNYLDLKSTLHQIYNIGLDSR